MEPARCRNTEKWYHIAKNLEWHPRRLNDGEIIIDIDTVTQPSGWRLRRFAAPDGKVVIHGLAAKLELRLDDELEAKRTAFLDNNIITDVIPRDALPVPKNTTTAELYLPPDKTEPLKLFPEKGCVKFTLPENCFCFLVSCQ